MKPEWLLVHRILNHKHLRDGRMMYLVKWRDLPYSLATWEHENSDFADLKSFIDYYWVNLIFLFYNYTVLYIYEYFFSGIKSIL